MSAEPPKLWLTFPLVLALAILCVPWLPSRWKSYAPRPPAVRVGPISVLAPVIGRTPRAIVFLNSINSTTSRLALYCFREAAEQMRDGLRVPPSCFMIAMEEPGFDDWTKGLSAGGEFFHSGNGTILWLEGGRLAAIEEDGFQGLDSPEAILARTRALGW